MASEKSDKLLVAAIDFGTTYSGYAFSMRDKPMEVQTPQTWYAGSTQLSSLKTPTCLLLESTKKFHSFGYEAENKYAEIAANYEQHDWYFFQNFKMILHNNKNLSKSTKIDDISGKSIQALKVFSLSIEYFKNHLTDTLNTRAPGINLDDVHFVITVPAIWNDSAKQFMREAAIEAGLENNQLSLALEPEAASVFCQQLPTEKLASSGKFEIAKAGTEYMVIDLGGGTADITVHRKEVDGTLKSLHAATGGPWGGLMVNKEYINVINEIVGKDTKVMETFQNEEMGDYFDLLRDFESKKRTVTPVKEGIFFIRIPVSLKDIYEKRTRNSFEEAVDKSRYNEHITFLRDKLKVDTFFMKQLFQSSIESILQHVSDILQRPEMENVGRILMVGGYSECPLVHRAFIDMFGEKRMIIPHEAGLAVIKGAVHFGHNPFVISSRILSYTYGIKSRTEFKEGIHPEDRRTTNDQGEYRCKGIFLVYKRSGDIVKLGEKVSSNHRPAYRSLNSIKFSVFVASDPNPEFVTDKGCILLGNLKIDISPYSGEFRTVSTDFVFGGTEFMVEATEDKTGKKIRKYFDLQE